MSFPQQNNGRPFKINGRVGEDIYRFNQRIEVQKLNTSGQGWEWHCNVSECQNNELVLEFWTTITAKPVIILIDKNDIRFLEEGANQ